MNKIRRTRKGHEPYYIPVYGAGPQCLLNEVALPQDQITLFTGLLTLLTWIVQRPGTTHRWEIFLVIPPEVLPSDHHTFGFKSSVTWWLQFYYTTGVY